MVGARGTSAAALAGIVLAAGFAVAADDAAVVADFAARVKGYVAQEEAIKREVPGPGEGDDAATVAAHEHAVGERISTRRGGTRIFTERSSALFRRRIAEVIKAPGGAQIRSEILDDNPGEHSLRPNSPYPSGRPVSTVPLRVLQALPPLPEAVEYRFVGGDLVLRSVCANLILDFVPNALP